MSDIHIYNQDLEWVASIDDAMSLMWATKYREHGRFELQLPIRYSTDANIIAGNYLRLKNQNDFMLIEDINPSEGDEDTVFVKGPSGESILKNRVIQDPISVSGNLNDIVRGLIQDNFIAPTDPNRTVPYILWEDNPILQNAVLFGVSDVFKIGTIYDIAKKLCDGLNVGIKVEMAPYPQKSMTFSLYSGDDLSHLQTNNPRVIFSEKFDNVLESSVFYSNRGVKNHMLMITDDAVVSLQKTPVYITTNEPTGINRKEGVLELSISRASVTPPLNDTEMLNIITSNGITSLIEKQPTTVFDGEFDTTQPFKYDEDYKLGDLVQCDIANSPVRARIIESVVSLDSSQLDRHIAFEFNI